ncbi:MAG: hypothetical protein LIP09_09700 [Bacteroidales bacterium]|nr:hypothetical protein [Bacteroidales bacterium]
MEKTEHRATDGNLSGWSKILAECLKSWNDDGNISVLEAVVPQVTSAGLMPFEPLDNPQPRTMAYLAIITAPFFHSKALQSLARYSGELGVFSEAWKPLPKETQQRHVIEYKKYDDQTLNPHITDIPKVAGNTMILCYDNTVFSITLHRETAKSVAQKAVPVNTLANAIVDQYGDKLAKMAAEIHHITIKPLQQEENIQISLS